MNWSSNAPAKSNKSSFPLEAWRSTLMLAVLTCALASLALWAIKVQLLDNEFLQGKGEFVPMQEQIAFKHSREMQFATMTMADYLTEKCRLTDRHTRQVYEFDDIEDLLSAGWRLD